MVLWTPRQEIYCFSHVSKYTQILLSVTNLWLFAVHVLYWKMSCSSGNRESCLWVFFKTSNKIHSAKKAKKCLSNTQERRKARNATWWQNIKIICSRSLAARHNPTCSARQQAVKHSATLTCKNIFFFFTSGKEQKLLYWSLRNCLKHVLAKPQGRSAGEDSTAASLQTPSCLYTGIQGQKTQAAPKQHLTFRKPEPDLRQKKLDAGFSESTASSADLAQLGGQEGNDMDSIRTALSLLRSLFLSTVWPTNTTLLHAGNHQHQRNLLLLLHNRPAFTVFTCSRHTNRKTP